MSVFKLVNLPTFRTALRRFIDTSRCRIFSGFTINSSLIDFNCLFERFNVVEVAYFSIILFFMRYYFNLLYTIILILSLLLFINI